MTTPSTFMYMLNKLWKIIKLWMFHMGLVKRSNFSPYIKMSGHLTHIKIYGHLTQMSMVLVNDIECHR